MSGFVSIAVERRLSTQLARAREEAVDLTAPMAEISEVMLEHTHRRFDAEVGPGGVPWKRSQRAIEDGGKTLYEKGFLYRALDRNSGVDFAEVGVKPGAPQSAYAAIHQFGGEIRAKAKKALSFGGRVVTKVIMPARPYLGFDPDELEEAEDILADHLRGAFAEGGRA